MGYTVGPEVERRLLRHEHLAAFMVVVDVSAETVAEWVRALADQLGRLRRAFM